MKIIQVMAGMDNLAAGPSYTVPRLCKTLARRAAGVELHVLEPVPAMAESTDYAVKTYPVPAGRLGRKLGFSPAMSAGLSRTAADIVHNHGLWLLPNLYACRQDGRRERKIVISPRGMLSPWALNHSRWKKRLMWFLAQKEALFRADCLHATALSEYEDIRRLGVRAPVAVIPNGIDLPAPRPDFVGHGRRRLVFLARIHPQKGLAVLLEAWARLEKRFPDWELVIAGPDPIGYLDELKKQAAALDLGRIAFRGPVYGDEKSRLLYSADLYVLPSYSENFGMTVAEALAHGVPAIVTRGAPWGGLETQGCGWWIELGEDALAACLADALSTDRATLREMGARGRAWMERDYGWDPIGEMMHRTYRWLLAGGEPPDWVFCDGR
jgi:glycosyltransferase involved in cell wall biosynthesis